MSCKLKRFKKRIFENYEANALLEMATDKASYEKWMFNHSWELYEHLIYVVTLETYLPECVEHWIDEIRNFTKPVVDANLKKGCKNLNRALSIERQMMEPQMGVYFEDYRIDEFEKALKNEIRKNERILKDEFQKHKWHLAKKEIEIVKEVIRIVGEYVEPNRDRIRNFYSDFKKAAVAEDVYMLEDAIAKFVDTEPLFQED